MVTRKSIKKVSGAPPKYHSDEDVHVIGKELLDWLEDESHEVWHLSEWYYGVKKMLEPEWRTLRQRTDFLPYYESAIKRMGVRMIKNSEMPTAYGSRFLNIYFSEVREMEKAVAFEKIDHEAEMKAKADINKQVAPNEDKLERLITSLDALKKEKE